jgi:Dihaem cytochrome c
MIQLFKLFLGQSAQSAPTGQKLYKRKRGRSPLFLVLLLLLWSLILGLGLAQASEPAIGTVDPVPPRHQYGHELYLQTCGTCHIAIPPAVLPSQTWRQIIQDTQHYGVELPPLLNPSLTLIWNYLRDFSRPIPESEPVPYRVSSSRYFKALHPRVELPRPTTLQSCVTCHPGALDYDFRRLAPEWEDAP